MSASRSQLWLCTVPAMILPLLGSLFYFVLFSDHSLARILYGGTKTFTLLWPIIAVLIIFKTPLPRLNLRDPRHLRSIPLGLLVGLIVGGAAFGLMQTPIGTVIEGSAGTIRDKASALGFIKYYWAFALFLSLFHSLLEEYYWRWFVYGNLAQLLKPAAAHLLAALAFASHHVVVATQCFPLLWGFLLGALVGVGGLIFSLLYARQGTLTGAWAAHILIDLALMTIGHQLIFA